MRRAASRAEDAARSERRACHNRRLNNVVGTYAPPLGTELFWTASGDAELSNEGNGTALFTAGSTRGPVNLKLKVKNGPYAGRVLSNHDFTVLEPTGTATRQARWGAA